MTVLEKKIATEMIKLLKKLKYDATLVWSNDLIDTCPDYDFCNEQTNGLFYEDWSKNLEMKYKWQLGKDGWMDLMAVHRIAVASNTKKTRLFIERDKTYENN